MKRGGKSKIIIAVIVLIILGVFAFRDSLTKLFLRPTESNVQTGIPEQKPEDIETIAENLTVPWGLANLPNGDLLITERSGKLQRIGNPTKQIFTIEGVSHVGEGGLLGVAVDPEYERNQRIYLYLTTRTSSGLTNRIERYSLRENTLENKQIIMQNIPGEANHDGGRIAFGPDKLLYVTTGDAGNENSAQDINSLSGKILRITIDGRPARDNPFQNNPVYSFGHRNPQGLAWDDKGRLWSTEHGRSGARSGFDELNLIKRGGNYGWPVIEGDQTAATMEKPVVHSGAGDTWAPAGLAHIDGNLFFAGLRGQTLYQAVIKPDDTVELKAHYKGQFGRLRTTHIIDSSLLFTTSNTDGRGTPKSGDDRVLKLPLSVFN